MSKAITDIFIDTDAGWDDWCAISLLCLSSDANIKGIAVNGCGESYLVDTNKPDQFGGVNNTLNLLALAKKEDIPVYIGNDGPTSYYNVFPDAFKQSVTELLHVDVTLPRSPVLAVKEDASVALAQALNESPDLTYLSIGGLSGLSTYIQKGYKKMPQNVVIMGGSIYFQEGNIRSLFPEAYPHTYAAEWNIFVDPVAANNVLTSALMQETQIMMVTLDSTNQVPLTQTLIDKINPAGTIGTVAEFIHAVLQKRYDDASKGGYTEYFYDPLAAMYVLYPDKLGSRVKGALSVQTDLNTQSELINTLGRTSFVADPENNHGFLNLANSGITDFYNLFVEIINSSAS